MDVVVLQGNFIQHLLCISIPNYVVVKTLPFKVVLVGGTIHVYVSRVYTSLDTPKFSCPCKRLASTLCTQCIGSDSEEWGQAYVGGNNGKRTLRADEW